LKIVVTGASGFLGSWICRYLAGEHTVAALIRPTSSTFRLTGVPNLKIVAQDFRNWSTIISSVDPDVLILADWWGVGNNFRDDQRQFDNVNRIESLCKLLQNSGIKLVIGLGSQAEFGPKHKPISDNTQPSPTSKYGFAKMDMKERLEKIYAQSRTRFVWGRIFSTYGPLDTGEWLIPRLVSALSDGLKFDLTKGEQEWSYLHAYDIHGSINIGNPETIILKDAVEYIASIIGSSDLLNFGAISYRDDQVMVLKPKCENLSKAGWEPLVSFESGLEQTISWLQNKDLKPLSLSNKKEVSYQIPKKV
jgi:nucleoside-diphosphate-sugar epimerase